MRFIQDSLHRLRVISLLEGISLLVLLGIAMPLKYMLHLPAAVRLVGMAHGILFIAYVLLLIQNAMAQRWSVGKVGLGLLASVVPFGAIYAERNWYQPALVPMGKRD